MDNIQLSTSNITIAAASTAAGYMLYKTLTSAASKSSISSLQGPKSSSTILGHMAEMVDPTPQLIDKWISTYGLTMSICTPLSVKGVYSADPSVAAYVFNNAMNFKKPEFVKSAIYNITGPGVFAMEGEVNRKQRRVLNPAFSMAQVKQLTPTMIVKTQELKNAWINELATATPDSTIDVLDWLGHMALDIIGEAGFGYQFNTLHDHASGVPKNELAAAFEELLAGAAAADVIGILGLFIPFVQKLPFKRNIVALNCKAVMHRIGSEIVQEKKKDLDLAKASGKADQLVEKDVLSAILRCNMQEIGAGKITDDEVLAQIATFIVAGQDSSSASITWALYRLSKSKDIQAKLRSEVLAFPNDNPSFDELNTLTYLDWVVKETLRLDIPVPLAQRVPLTDVVIPLSSPVVGKNGEPINEIFLRAGETIIVSTGGLNFSNRFWGSDSHEFKPERYAKLPEEVANIPSAFGNVTTFISGPRMCIGWRFAVAEMKAALFTLIRTFEFDIDPTLVIGKRSTIFARPFIVGDPDSRTRLPLKVSLYKEPSSRGAAS
ncbi:hypothetical protein FRB95_012505 [Tulasnella sp. JGI-2019a]|nr:hypothetical protein FRB95_012505 [Tulasnella sp. JGI-2019a]